MANEGRHPAPIVWKAPDAQGGKGGAPRQQQNGEQNRGGGPERGSNAESGKHPPSKKKRKERERKARDQAAAWPPAGAGGPGGAGVPGGQPRPGVPGAHPPGPPQAHAGPRPVQVQADRRPENERRDERIRREDDRRHDRRDDRRYDRRDDRRADRRDDRWDDRRDDRWDDRRDDRWDDRWDRRNDRRPYDRRDGGERHGGRQPDKRQRHDEGGRHRYGHRGGPGERDHQNFRHGTGQMMMGDHRQNRAGDWAPPPMVPELPQSPVITRELGSLASSFNLVFDEHSGLDRSKIDVMKMRILRADDESLKNGLKSWAETEDQCRRMAMRLGLTPQEEHLQPFSRDMIRSHFEGETNEQDEKREQGEQAVKVEVKVEDGPKEIAVIPEIPYRRDALKATEDPRLGFKDEYELMQAWVNKPRPLPSFAAPKGNGAAPDSPTHSWSRDSPMKTRGSLDGPHDKKGGKDDKTNRRDSDKSDRSVKRYDDSQRMELEEGYFSVRLLTGESALLQFGEIVDLIRKGDLPDGWSAHRESDDLWISVYMAAADDGSADKEVEDRFNAAAAANEAAAAGSNGHVRPKPGIIAEHRKDQPPGSLRDEFVRMARESRDARPTTNGVNGTDTSVRPVTSQPALKFARKTASSANPSVPGASPPKSLPTDFAEAAEAAYEQLSAYDRVLAVRSNAKLLCGAPKPVDAAVRAMIKDKVMADRNRLRDIGGNALQKALRIFVQRKALSDDRNKQ